MSKAIGIDFGTSNSTVGFSEKGRPRLIALESGKLTIPSAIFYDTEEKQTLFGRRAIATYVENCEGRLLRALKSILGSSLIDDTTQVGGRRQSFKAIIGEFLSHLKTTAEQGLGREVDSVVLGRPVCFVDDDPVADLAAQNQLEQAARSVGFTHIQFQYEPIAAALDYEQSVGSEELALIADIGGGTSDFSLVRVSPERRGQVDRKGDILANTGVHVGGTDLDRKLSLSEIMPLLGYQTPQRARPELDLPSSFFHDLATWHKIMLLYNNKTHRALQDMRYVAAREDLVDRLIQIVKHHDGHRLAGDVELAKIALSQQEQTSLKLGYVEAGLEIKLHRDRFESATEVEHDKIAKQIRECLVLAKVKASQVNTLFLTGGTTAIPSVLDVCKKAVPHARVVAGDKLGSVGIGLAIDAGIKFGAVGANGKN